MEQKRELEWWEDVTLHLNKMPFPDYLKDTNGIVHKITRYAIDIKIKALVDEGNSIPVRSSSPATEEDYENYINLKKDHSK
jgi:hypothetical protein